MLLFSQFVRGLKSCRICLWGAALIFAIGVPGLSAATGNVGAADGQRPVAKFVVALKPDKNPEILRAEKTQLEAFLSAQLGRPAEAIIPLSSTVILEGFANGTVDLGYLSATDFVNARSRGLADLLLVGQFPGGRNAYDSYWVVKKDAPYASIADLRGRPVAFAGRTSTSGFVVPLFDLKTRDLLGQEAYDALFPDWNPLQQPIVPDFGQWRGTPTTAAKPTPNAALTPKRSAAIIRAALRSAISTTPALSL
jgi:ABC-type phosphate/phosphonate transport system substrate-binding protein